MYRLIGLLVTSIILWCAVASGQHYHTNNTFNLPAHSYQHHVYISPYQYYPVRPVYQYNPYYYNWNSNVYYYYDINLGWIPVYRFVY